MSASHPSLDRSRLLLILAVAVLVLVGVGAAGFAYFFTGSAPAEVSLTSEASQAAAAATAAPVSPAAPASSTSTGTMPSGVAGSLDGTWNLDTSIGSFSDFSDSFVGYRVNETLAQVGSATAVGRTPKVSGSLTFGVNTISAATITADLTALQSDKPQRDDQLRRQGLETDQFPTATFQLTAPVQLPSTPADGQTFNVTATGKLTLHGVTNRVSIPLQAKLSGNTVTVVGSLKIQFADYNISPPQSMMVLSVDSSGVMELQLHFTKV